MLRVIDLDCCTHHEMKLRWGNQVSYKDIIRFIEKQSLNIAEVLLSLYLPAC